MRRLLPLVLVLAACPQANPVDPAAGKVEAPPVIDGRVVTVDGDLYPTKTGKTAVAPPPPSPGTGVTDETNGKCRLYAPELPDPTCCARELGFDVATVQAACGLKIYLGESFYGTCGYHFVPDAVAGGAAARWFRMSLVAEPTAKEAAEAHDRRARKRGAGVTAAPFPGVDGVYWSSQDELHWAFVPGWSSVRMFTWSDASCSPEGVARVLSQLVAAPEVAAGTPRTSLVPSANPAAAPAPAPPATPAGPARAAG
ncbi:MAG: hypothetical protein JNL82_13765 [Myxococcales bacterium]|nr:hypothetical protein [Myxococcales bacterium]